MPNFAISSIHGAFRRLELDRIAPARIHPDTVALVDLLAERYPDDDSSLTRFFCGLPLYALERNLLDQVLPDSLTRHIKTLRDEQESLAIQKEQKIGQGDFQAAANCRDRQYEIVAEARKLLGDELEILPNHLTTSLRLLGYTGDLGE